MRTFLKFNDLEVCQCFVLKMADRKSCPTPRTITRSQPSSVSALNKTRDMGHGTPVVRPGGRRTQDIKRKTRHPGHGTPDTGLETHDTGHGTLDTGGTPDTGQQTRDTETPKTEYRTRDTGGPPRRSSKRRRIRSKRTRDMRKP